VSLWATLKANKALAFDLRRSGRSFPISALEPSWDRQFPGLDRETRRVLLIDLVEQGDAASLTLSVQAAARDPSADVVSGVIDYLDFRDEPYHPDIESGHAWPTAAEPVWIAMGYDVEAKS